jgi:hypothetical protein
VAHFIHAIRATLAEVMGAGDVQPPALPDWLPECVQPVAERALRQLCDYQGAAYAGLYLDRLRRFVRRRDVSDELLCEIARLLEIRMSYLDPIRIAQQVLTAGGVGAHGGPARPVVEVHVFRIDELISALPAIASEPVLDLLEWLGRLHMPIRIRFSTASWFGVRRLKCEAGLRRWRQLSVRYARERALTERWLHMIERSLDKAPAAAMAVTQTAEMLHGIGGPYRHRLADWNLIIDRLAKPVFDGELVLPDLADAIVRARRAAEVEPRPVPLEQVVADIRADAALPAAAQ